MPVRFSKLLSCALAIVVLSLSESTTAMAQTKARPESLPQLLSLREQLSVRERWLKTRLDTMLLPMMRRHKVAMWIVTNEEFHPETVVPFGFLCVSAKCWSSIAMRNRATPPDANCIAGDD
jgi:hypothetical protein